MSKHKNIHDDFVNQAIENAKIGIWHWDILKDEINITPPLAQIMGYSINELNSLTIKKWGQFKHPEDVDKFQSLIKQVLSKEISFFFIEHRIRHKNGSWINIQSNGRVTQYDLEGNPLIMTGTFIDISELQQSRESLHYRYQIEKLVSGISADFVGINLLKLDATIKKTLKKIGQFCKIDRSYVFILKQNNTYMDNTHEWCAPGIHPEIENLQNLPTSVFPWWMKKMNRLEYIHISHVNQMPQKASAEQQLLQSQNIYSLLVVPIHYKKKLLGFMGFDSVNQYKEWSEADIHLLETVGNTLANALNARQDQKLLIEAKEKAEESNRLKSAFLATINHELRTPLHHILGFSELMRDNKLPEGQSQIFSTRIYDSGKNLLEIIENILNLALADQSEIKIKKEIVKGADLFSYHKSLLDEILVTTNKQNNINLRYQPDPKFLRKTFMADKSKINQIILNLFKNAIKFTDSGSIEYGIRIDKHQQLIFYVKDTGIGIPKNQQRIIFDFFRQGNDTPTRQHSGIGIGLSISQKIAEILNGRLTVKSAPGEGSIFSLKIPVEIIPDPKPNQYSNTESTNPLKEHM